MKNEINISQVYHREINHNTRESDKYDSGERFYNLLRDLDFKPLSFLFSSSDILNTRLVVVVIDEPIVFYNNNVNVPVEGTIILTSFLYDFMENNEVDLSFFEYGFYGDVVLNVDQVVDIKYNDKDAISHKNDINFQYDNQDLFQTKYAFSFISKETLNYIKNVANNKLFGSNFFKSSYNTKIYAESSSKYGKYDNEIVIGSKPILLNEIVVSEHFLELNKDYLNIKNNEEIIGHAFEFKDLNNSPNFIIYQSMINLYDIQPDVIISGITKDDSNDVYVSEVFYDKLNEKRNFHLSGFFIDSRVSKTKINSLLEKGVFFYLSDLLPILSINMMVNSDFFSILIFLESALLIITTLYLVISCGNNVKEKYKELSILKSLGVTNPRIYSIFIILNSFISVAATALGLVLSNKCLHFFNLVMMSPNVFNINYSLFTASFTNHLLILIGVIGISMFSTLIAFFKIRKIDIAAAIKMF